MPNAKYINPIVIANVAISVYPHMAAIEEMEKGSITLKCQY
jgi:hypothetical protein